MGCGGSSPKVEQAPTLIPSQQDIVNAISGTATPGIGPISQTGVDMMPLGMRFTSPDPYYGQAARGAVNNLAQPFDQFAAPFMSHFQENITPDILERFASFGGAGSGGAQAAMAKGGAQYLSSLAQPWLQAQGQVPTLAGQASQLEMQGPEAQRQAEQMMWLEERGLAGPYLDLGRSIIPSTNQFAENIAEPGQQSFLQSAAPGLAMAPFLMSDERVKEGVETIENALERLDKLDGKMFKFKGCDDTCGGIIAQDLEKALPEAVKEINGVKHVNYHAVIGLLINAVKELKQAVLPLY